jgi:hypothetical protein
MLVLFEVVRAYGCAVEQKFEGEYSTTASDRVVGLTLVRVRTAVACVCVPSCAAYIVYDHRLQKQAA